MLDRTETRTRDRLCFQAIRTVCDISRDDRARIATCSLLTSTARFNENHSIDNIANDYYVTITITITIITTSNTDYDYKFDQAIFFTKAIGYQYDCPNDATQQTV